MQFMCRASGDITALGPTACGQIITWAEVAYTRRVRKSPCRDRTRACERIEECDHHDEDDIYPTADRHDVARSGTAYALWSGNEKTRTG